MKRLIVVVALLLSCATLIGWKARDVRDGQSCSYLADVGPPYKGYISRLPVFSRDIPPDVIAEIYRCWAIHPKSSMMRQLRLEDARQLTKSTYLLAFGIWGVSDASLIFVVNADGKVTGAYSYPYSL
jgi:hypothetical protein